METKLLYLKLYERLEEETSDFIRRRHRDAKIRRARANNRSSSNESV